MTLFFPRKNFELSLQWSLRALSLLFLMLSTVKTKSRSYWSTACRILSISSCLKFRPTFFVVLVKATFLSLFDFGILIWFFLLFYFLFEEKSSLQMQWEFSVLFWFDLKCFFFNTRVAALPNGTFCWNFSSI